ncbi:MAG: hypothetical protein HUK26_08035 [Duodenibacillus sp.]|nr:hypothetical protein [Duodenibacillus sp.]
MLWQAYRARFSALRAEALASRLVILGLTGLSAAMAGYALTREPVVTVIPWTLSGESQVESAGASRGFVESWGLAVAYLVGNATPGNVDFVGERLAPLLAPEAHQAILEGLHSDAEDLKAGRVVQRFSPESVALERASGIVYVEGASSVRRGTSLSPEHEERRTYEIGVRVRRYRPEIWHIGTYAGPPRLRSAPAGARGAVQAQGRRP